MINSPIRFGRPGLFGPQPAPTQQPAAAPSMAPAWGAISRIDPDGVRRPAVNFLDSTAGGGGMMPGYGADFGAMPDAMPQTPGMFIQPPSFGGGGGPPAPARNPHGQGADPFDPRSKFAGGKFYATGGPVSGPGDGDDDLVPAMLSDGEFVMPAAAVKFFGLDKLNKMKEKAKEGLAEMKMPNDEGRMTNDRGMMPLKMAAGGPVSFVNPYADNPALYAQRQREAYAAPLIADGITDMGSGMKTLANRYGTGFAVPAGNPLDTPGPGRFNNNGNTVTATPGQGLSMVPDIIPAGPWGAPALPFDNQGNRANIDFVQNQMQPGAPERRMGELMADVGKAGQIPRGSPRITVPDARPDFGAGPGKASAGQERYQYGKFMAPWEQDAAVRAQSASSDAALGRPAGMRQTDWNRLKRDPKFLMEQQAPITPDIARQMGLEIASVDSRGNMQFSRNAAGGDDLPKRLKELDALIADKKQPLHIRELARRERETAARESIAGGGDIKAPKLAQVPGSADSSFMPVSVQWDAKTGGWGPIQMAAGKGGAAPGAAAPNAAADRIAALRKKAGL